MRRINFKKLGFLSFVTTCLTVLISIFSLAASAASPDAYEDDDTYTNAGVIVVKTDLLFKVDDVGQKHNFHDEGDEDWIKFYGISGEKYIIDTSGFVPIDIVLYDTDGATVLPIDFANEYGISAYQWNCQQDGIYYIKISNYNPLIFGDFTYYYVRLFHLHSGDNPPPVDLPSGRGAAGAPTFIDGTVVNCNSGEPIPGALIKSDYGGSAITLPNGSYIMGHVPGYFTITVTANDCSPRRCSTVLHEGESKTKDILLSSLHDEPCNYDCDEEKPVLSTPDDGGAGCFIDSVLKN